MSNGMIGGPYDFDATNACIDSMERDIDALQGALRLACEELAATSGTCPYDAHDLYEPWEESCYQRCSADIDDAECWRRYFEQRSKGCLER